MATEVSSQDNNLKYEFMGRFAVASPSGPNFQNTIYLWTHRRLAQGYLRKSCNAIILVRRRPFLSLTRY